MSARTAARPTVDVTRLGEAVAGLVRATRREVTLPLGASTLAALRTVAEQGPMRLGDLARHEGVTPATLTRIVAVLEEEGCVERTADSADRRASLLAATTSGRALLDSVREERAVVMARRVARLTPEQAEALQTALDALEALAEG